MSSLAAPPVPGGTRDRSSAFALGRAELVLGALLLLGLALCFGTGTGFDGRSVFTGYFGFFGRYVLYLFLLVRTTNLVRDRWRPAGPLGRRLLGALGGPGDPREFHRSDTEFLRCLLVLVLTLTVYTNVKARIPFINDAVGDDLFQAIDQVVLGERFAGWVEQSVASRPELARFLDRVYAHDYVWMVALTLGLWVRSDAQRLRWLFVSFGLLYLTSVLITALYPSFGPFFVDWQRFEWARETQSGRAQAMLVGRFVRATELVAQGRPLVARAFEGIAAFPSLHVGHMVLIAVVAWSTSRLFAVFMAGVAFLTTVATVAFGWHYLVDDLAGAALAVGIAQLARRWSGPFSPPA